MFFAKIFVEFVIAPGFVTLYLANKTLNRKDIYRRSLPANQIMFLGRTSKVI